MNVVLVIHWWNRSRGVGIFWKRTTHDWQTFLVPDPSWSTSHSLLRSKSVSHHKSVLAPKYPIVIYKRTHPSYRVPSLSLSSSSSYPVLLSLSHFIHPRLIKIQFRKSTTKWQFCLLFSFQQSNDDCDQSAVEWQTQEQNSRRSADSPPLSLASRATRSTLSSGSVDSSPSCSPLATCCLFSGKWRLIGRKERRRLRERESSLYGSDYLIVPCNVDVGLAAIQLSKKRAPDGEFLFLPRSALLFNPLPPQLYEMHPHISWPMHTICLYLYII